MVRRPVLFADRPAAELRARAQKLRLAADTALTRKGMAMLLYLADRFEAAATERETRPPAAKRQD